MSTLYSNHSNYHATKLDQVSTFEIKISTDLLLNLYSQQVQMLLFADILAQTVRHIQNRAPPDIFSSEFLHQRDRSLDIKKIRLKKTATAGTQKPNVLLTNPSRKMC